MVPIPYRVLAMAPSTIDSGAVVVDRVSKAFRLPQERVHTLKERALHPFQKQRYEDLVALKDVSFTVEKGEFFGIVGRNGSGKSTLLKCIAGIYATDAGHIFLRGRMATFIELGVGFNPDLTARDNVIINAIMLGLTPAEARRRYDAVIDFSELREFEDLKLKNYSSGMYVRLAFATMIQVDADILVIDEVLAVGDASFQAKCHQTLQDVRSRGRTILFVTHDMASVENECDRAMLLERGDMAEIGEPDRVARSYDQLNFARGVEANRHDKDRHGDGCGTVVDAWFADENGDRTSLIERNHDCTMHVVAEFHEPVVDPVVGLSLGGQHVRWLFNTSSAEAHGRSGAYEAGERVALTVRFRVPFAPGRYDMSPWVGYGIGDRQLMDRREAFVPVTVVGERYDAGLVQIEHETAFERLGASVAEIAE
jgi:ABC-type polysaccharide/polyol phosphate transport system ATPase subunit